MNTLFRIAVMYGLAINLCGTLSANGVPVDKQRNLIFPLMFVATLLAGRGLGRLFGFWK